MTAFPEFEGFPSIPRLSREVIVTEKIDGANMQVFVTEGGAVHAASRNRWLEPDSKDAFGFAPWVRAHADELRQLGPGRHFGEWWGAGIQRRYGLAEKRFSLFNVARWGEVRPACCCVVPVLYRGPMSVEAVDLALEQLARAGSAAAPGFMQPEGVVLYHVKAGVYFKKTIGDDGHKGEGR